MNENPDETESKLSSSSFLTEAELATLRLAHLGKEVLISRFARFYYPENISIGDRSRIDDFSIISAKGGVNLGCNVHIGVFTILMGGAGIELQDFSGTSARVSIFSESEDPHGEFMTNPTVPPPFRKGLIRQQVVVERHAMVGAHSVILPGGRLSEGSILGAQSLLLKPSLPWSLYLGTPARRIRALSDKRNTHESDYRKALGQPA